jgi:hypothetical protein
MDICHEGSDGWFWDFKVGKFVNEVFVYGASYSGYDGNEGIGFPSIVLYGIY